MALIFNFPYESAHEPLLSQTVEKIGKLFSDLGCLMKNTC